MDSRLLAYRCGVVSPRDVFNNIKWCLIYIKENIILETALFKFHQNRGLFTRKSHIIK